MKNYNNLPPIVETYCGKYFEIGNRQARVITYRGEKVYADNYDVSLVTNDFSHLEPTESEYAEKMGWN